MRIAVVVYGIPTLKAPSRQVYKAFAQLNDDIECAIAGGLSLMRNLVISRIDQGPWSTRNGRELDVFVDGLGDADQALLEKVQDAILRDVSTFATQWLPEFRSATITIRSAARSSQTMNRV